MKNVFLKYGVMYGLVGFVSTLLYYHGVLGMGLNFVLGMGVLFFLLWLAGKEFKSKNEGYATFGELLKLYFMTILVGILLSIALTAVYNNVISEDQKAAIVSRMVESTMAMTKTLPPETH